MTENNKSIKIEFIKQLADLLSESDLTEIELEQDSLKIRLSRGAGQAAIAAPVAAAPATPAPVLAMPIATPLIGGPLAANDGDSPGAVRSPMVGTVFLSGEPDAKPFVDIGMSIVEGQTLMIVEAMKHMNQIAAPASGKVIRICVKNGDPVEYDQVLVVIE